MSITITRPISPWRTSSDIECQKSRIVTKSCCFGPFRSLCVYQSNHRCKRKNLVTRAKRFQKELNLIHSWFSSMVDEEYYGSYNKLSTIGLPLRGRHPRDNVGLKGHWRTNVTKFLITLSPRAEWSFLRVVSSLLLVPDGEMSVILISPLWRCCSVTLSCTCSSLRISEAVLEHADVFADRIRLPEAGINLLKFNKHRFQG